MSDQQILDQFQCSGCGECCRWGGAVLLEDTDIPVLAAHLGLSEQAFIDRHTRLAPNRRQLALLDQSDGSCEFLEGNRCRVYEARPVQCKTFPYAWAVSEGCPELDRLRGLE
jgi:Fe-S-cluster containining protein